MLSGVEFIDPPHTNETEFKTMPLIEFLEMNSIDWMPIVLETEENEGKVVKKLKSYPENARNRGCKPNFKDFWESPDIIRTRKEIFGALKYIWIDTSQIYQLDVDEPIDGINMRMPTPYYYSVGKELPHFFIRSSTHIRPSNSTKKYRYQTTLAGVELLCGQAAYAKRDSLVYLPREDIYTVSDPSDLCANPPPKREVITKDTNKESECTQLLNKHFNIEGDWTYDLNRCICVPTSWKCIINREHRHSESQCRVLVSAKTITAKCWACGTEPLPKEDNRELHLALKKYFQFVKETTSDDEPKWKDLVQKVDNDCLERNLRVSDEMVLEPTDRCCMEYVNLLSFEEYLDELFENESEAMKNAYKRPSARDNLIKYLRDNHVTIKRLQREPNVVAFRNGYLKLNKMEFKLYESKTYPHVAKIFLDFDFDPKLLETPWNEIECPIFDMLIKSQPQIYDDEAVRLAFYGLLGSIHYPMGHDSIKVVPILVGTSGTGKSTVVNIVLATFSHELKGTLNYKEKVFGKTAFLDHDVIYDTDVPANMISEFGKTEWQKTATGETISIPIKNVKQEKQWLVTNRQIYCSQYRQQVMDTGEVIRRIAYFDFVPVANTEDNLESRAINEELDKILIKILLARRELIERYKMKPFHEWGIQYFENKMEDVLIENNPVERMLSETTEFRYRKGETCNFNDFVIAFKIALPKSPVPKLTDVSFTKLGYHIEKQKRCKDCQSIFIKGKRCCAHHHKNNVTTTHVIRNLMQIDQMRRFRSDSNDSLR